MKKNNIFPYKAIHLAVIFLGVFISTAAFSYDNPAGKTANNVVTYDNIVSNEGSITGGSSPGNGDAIQSLGTNVVVTNSGSLIGDSHGIVNEPGGSITSLTNSGLIKSNTDTAIGNGWDESSSMGTLTNTSSGTIMGAKVGIWANSSIDSLINSGSIVGTSLAGINMYLQPVKNITNNAGANITGANGIIVGNQAVTSINNIGLVYAASGNGILITNTGSVQTITNTGTISAVGGYGISNSGVSIGTLNNLQGAGNTVGALTYDGKLPLSYNITISSPLVYGRLSASNVSGSTIWGVDPNSTIPPLVGGIAANYTSVISGLTTSNILNYSTKYYANDYTVILGLTPQGGSSTTWDLGVNAVISGSLTRFPLGSTIQTSSITTPNVLLNANTLQISSNGSIPTDFYLTREGGIIDQNGKSSTIAGTIGDATSGAHGSLTVINSAGSAGSVTLSAYDTYSGSTTVNTGATLALAGAGSIAQSSKVVNNGVFDISNATSGTSIQSLSGNGNVTLGSKTLTISNGADSFAGLVSGNGGLNIAGGTQTLAGSNTFSGGVQVQSGATLSVPVASALGTGTLSFVGNDIQSAFLNVTGTTAISNNISVAGHSVFNIANGTTTTVSSPIINGSTAGDIVVSGGGTLNLTAANTFSGATTVNSSSTLALSGSGSIAQSAGLTNNGNLDLTNASSKVSMQSYNQGASGRLSITAAPGNFQQLNINGPAVLAGSLVLTAGPGSYARGKYTVLTAAGGITGAFTGLTTNLSLYTPLGYGLTYDANDVYLLFTPNLANTQQSLANTAAELQNIYALQNSVLANSFSYDCNEFGSNGICISAGGRNTAVSATNSINNSSGLLIAAYRFNPSYRLGAYIDQNISVNNTGPTVTLGNNTPLIGLFGVWSERLDGAGAEIKLAAALGQKNTTVTRSVVGTGISASEPGSGSSQLNSQGAQLLAKYGSRLAENVIFSPYIGVRYTQNNMGGYTEAASTAVTSPLTYSTLNTSALTALIGLGGSYRFIPAAGLIASAGIETDASTSNGTYSATGISGLNPVNFNANPVRTRPTAMLGAYYDVEKHQRLGVTGIYRQEPYQSVSSTTVMATYTIGL